MFTSPHLSRALGHDWSLILRNIFLWTGIWTEQDDRFFKYPIQVWTLNVQSQTVMMGSRETVYIISIEMLWYVNCAINIILYWPVHYKRATDSNQPVFSLICTLCSDICEVVSLRYSLIYTVCTVIVSKVLCFCLDLTLYWNNNRNCYCWHVVSSSANINTFKNNVYPMDP